VQIEGALKREVTNQHKHRPKGLMKRIAILAVGISLMAPGAALASSSSTCQAYNPQLCVVSSSSSGSPGASAGSASGTLPFTGLDVVLLAVGGGTLVGAGFVVRRASRRLN
jgi:hypothetical protein